MTYGGEGLKGVILGGGCSQDIGVSIRRQQKCGRINP